jgi:hypothetical protein
VLSALIAAGELECGLADSAWASLPYAQSITDFLARASHDGASLDLVHIFSLLRDIERSLPDSVCISRPEGFAYYALHPADFAEAVIECVEHGSVGVIGIRSIGTTLSAAAVTALTERGISASRITIRPVGHPYNREAKLTHSQIAWLEQHRQKGSVFLIVDEGPGLSGSSFLSVAEALERHGINPARVTLLGTRDVDPIHLCADDATRRWVRFKREAAHSTIARTYSDHISLSNGSWREILPPRGVARPACWTEMERLKFLASDHRYVFKFDGLGLYGEHNRKRAEALFEAGFAPKPTQAKAGMASYDFVPGFPMTRADLSTEVLDRIADYCAFRTCTFHTESRDDQLIQMLQFNLQQEMKVHVEVPSGHFQSETTVIPDCRMQPHEWVRSSSGKLVKIDGNADGDGHFLPGPTDILWDLAGAIIEWNLNRDAEEYLLAQFRKRAGVPAKAKLPWFLLAYSVFRMSHCKMAYSSTLDVAEKRRLNTAARYYRCQVNSALRRPAVAQLGRRPGA